MLPQGCKKAERQKHPSVAMLKNGSGVLVCDIALGSLSIDKNTTVDDFANALISQNDGCEAGDQVTFFYGRQAATTAKRASNRFALV